MRIVFMGTPSFAVPSLAKLAAAHDIIAVYCRPDAVSGRGSHLRPSPVAAFADLHSLPLRQPNTLRSAEEVSHLISLAPDAIIVAAYGLILPPDVLAVPPLGCINIHGSLLPRWRGAAPVQRAILAGDEVTGISIMRMDEGLDTGAYCARVSTRIGSLNTTELTARLATLGAELLMTMLPDIESGTCEWVEQDATLVTYAEKVTPADVALSPDVSVQDALRRVRASAATTPSRIRIDGKGVTLLACSAGELELASGEFVARQGAVEIGVVDGSVRLERIKPEGRSEMDAAAWARGLRGDEISHWGPS